MKDFNRGGGFGDRRGGANFSRRSSGSRDARRDSRGGDDARPTMHKAICADCGSACEVPFKPSGDRPVLCSNCFKGKDGQRTNRSNERDFSRSSFGDKKFFKATCAECGESCEVPFQPSSGKPVYCSNCFGGKDDKPRNMSHGDHKTNYPTKEQFEMLNAKLDEMLRALKPKTEAKSEIKAEPKSEIKVDLKSKVKSEPKTISKKIVKKATPLKATTPKKAKKK